MTSEAFTVVPGHSLGPIFLGSSLQETLSMIKEDKAQFPSIELCFSQTTPLAAPVVVNLPEIGVRLQFDGVDQRLRLIEVLDFRRIALVYKGSELAKDRATVPYKRIYQLFSASYPGEYASPTSGNTGTYVVSYPGIAFTFPLQHAAWGPEKDHVQLLGSHAASPATFMAIFAGKSWPEARDHLFVSEPSGPRCAAIANQPKDALAAELELAYVGDAGKVTFYRRAPAPPLILQLGHSTLQDLITELGPPEATHKRDTSLFAEPAQSQRPRTTSTNGRTRPTPPSSYSSTGTDTFDTDFDSGDAEDDPVDRASREVYWCYFRHGLDILTGPPSADCGGYIAEEQNPEQSLPLTFIGSSERIVVRKIIMHGNIPGSYVFNRHRRLRWALAPPKGSSSRSLTSEDQFDTVIQPELTSAFASVYPVEEMSRGKVVNRTWGGGAGASDSAFFLPDAEEDLVEGGVDGMGASGSEAWLGNTKLHAFPGLTFEVCRNGTVSALTVS